MGNFEGHVGRVDDSKSSNEKQEIANQIVNLDMRLSEEIMTINKTLLAMATHMADQSTPTLEKVDFPKRSGMLWSPEQSDMLLWTKNREGVSWRNHYKGGKIFLICSGPSLNTLDLSLLNNRGVMTMCMNNSWCKFKPDLWIGFDVPGRFHNSGWMDRSVMKIVPWHRRKCELNHRVEGQLVGKGLKAEDAPNCWFLSNNANFNVDTWLSEESANWGGKVEGLKPEGGFRVTMIGALRTLYYLGFQEVYLLGCDFEMPMDMDKEAYAFEEHRAKNVRDKNNDMYRWIQEVFEKLKPSFARSGFQIYNCNPNSKLKSFPFMDYREALQRSVIPEFDDTRGWYGVDNK